MNFEQRKSEILRRSQLRIARRKRSRRIALAACCAATVCLLALPVSRLGHSSAGNETMQGIAPTFQESLELQPVDSTVEDTGTDSLDILPEALTDTVQLVVNPSTRGSALADIDAQIHAVNPQNPEHQAAFAAFTGWTLEGLVDALPVTGPGKTSLSTMSVGIDPVSREYLLHDYVLEYSGEDGGQLRIALSPLGAPLRCVVFLDENAQPSNIRGAAVTVREANGAYYASFSHQGLHFDIETQGITQQQLTQLLVSLVSRR